MKTLIALASLTFALSSVAADAAKPQRTVAQPKPQGDVIERIPRTRYVVIRNKQSVFSAGELAAAAETVKLNTYLPIKIVGGDEAVPDTGVDLTLLDAPVVKGTTLTVSPEQAVGTLAVGWLVADNPAAEKRERRLFIELTRSILAALGVGFSMYQPDIMTYVTSVADLDRMTMDHPNPETVNNISYATKKRAIKQVRFATYRRACEEGWAPSPTNDEQRAIWDDVRKLPSDPIKIKFDPKRDK